jgi:hypothetical protein
LAEATLQRLCPQEAVHEIPRWEDCVSLYKGEYFATAQALAQSPTGKNLLRARQMIVEGVIGEAKNFHLLNRCRYRTLHRFRIQLLLTAAAINPKRLMRDANRRIESRAIAMDCPVLTFARLTTPTRLGSSLT